LTDFAPLLVLIVGPTAAGKTRVAAQVARKFAGEVVGADSIQVYRGLDAASDKPSAELRKEIPHHLIDIQDPGTDFSAGDYARLAAAAIDGIAGRRRLPIVAGGTGLYVRSLLRGLADLPGRRPELRERLERWEARRGEGCLHAMLRELDPLTADRLASRDRQRVIRAVEVALVEGRPLSAILAQRPFSEDLYPCLKIGLTAPRNLLNSRIDERVDDFFRQGLVEEVGRLLAAGIPPSANCFKALGYREVLRHLAGDSGYDETIALVKANTRRYARRQLTWFRKEPGIRWFEPEEDASGHYAEIEACIAERLKAEESRDGERKSAGSD
jgi:tRNA dimethylallyltransferase